MERYIEKYCDCVDVCGGRGGGEHRVHPDWVGVGMPATYYIDRKALAGHITQVEFIKGISRRRMRYVWARVEGYPEPRRFKVERNGRDARMLSWGYHGELVVGHARKGIYE